MVNGVQGVLEATSSRAREHSSESNEHYTPALVVDPARQTLGGIDLDPASCEEANRVIRADRFFTYDDDGFTRDWLHPLGRPSRVFLNPPGGLSDAQQRTVRKKCGETGACGIAAPHVHEGAQSSQKKWWFKLVREHQAGRVKAAVFVCFSVELLQTTQNDPSPGALLPLDCAICFPRRRVPYVKPGGAVGSSPPHASCVVYVGEDRVRFAHAFSHLGRVIGA